MEYDNNYFIIASRAYSLQFTRAIETKKATKFWHNKDNLHKEI
jgi:hypothetical protein